MHIISPIIKSTLLFKIILLASIGSMTLLSACKPPIRIYKIDIRQGNYITKNVLDKLRTGQSKEQVQAILGSPAHKPVLEKDTWIYDYSLIPGSRNRRCEKKQLGLNFVHNKLQSYTGDWDIIQLKKVPE